MIRGIQHDLISNNKYLLRFAQDENDITAAQRLRFNVFNIELGEGLKRSEEQGLDADKYDEQCHHLLVIHKETANIIGTYRLQTYDTAKQREGFYTANEFNLNSIPAEVLSESVEVGRACIAAEHRNGRVLFLLWRGLAKYLISMNKRYLFGCCSLTSQSAAEGWNVMKYLEMKNYIHDRFMVTTTAKYKCNKVAADENRVAEISLPQLFRLYMDLGAKVCSPPAIDREFKTIDYLVLLDINTLDERSRMLFFN